MTWLKEWVIMEATRISSCTGYAEVLRVFSFFKNEMVNG